MHAENIYSCLKMAALFAPEYESKLGKKDFWKYNRYVLNVLGQLDADSIVVEM